ncbi:hypothetical protein [Allorhodopirellula heiligendammensis]|uniref:Uncharacterized protein n=1 Tax=Allorhodopirellula heiligendammensis TaxID=2714739 RepID=A0A5C6BWB7_9BACT|nr:hypothetical protein [Allorhodopirellula heiligendammensis]TWU15044.1 hypothetical protein Poly21_22350 [Allorhodopirellula heiligendammensis]
MDNLGHAYHSHNVFEEIKSYSDFYSSLGISVFTFVSGGTRTLGNIDSYMYTSAEGTLESIGSLLMNGRINDAYALVRKYFDSTVMSVYVNLYLQDHFGIENFLVEKINQWVEGKESLPEYRVMSQYIRKSQKAKAVSEILFSDKRYKELRARCNDHTHYNFYKAVLLNDRNLYLKNREKLLDQLSHDIRDIFIYHISFVFLLNGHYMMSSDYVDAMECGATPEDDSQYWVAPFVQQAFSEVLSRHRSDVAAVIKANSFMKIE